MSKNVSISNVLKVLSDQKTQKLLRALIEAQEVQSQPLIVEWDYQEDRTTIGSRI